jgi:hypothetical protein
LPVVVVGQTVALVVLVPVVIAPMLPGKILAVGLRQKRLYFLRPVPTP